jgi:hypothetical protein
VCGTDPILCSQWRSLVLAKEHEVDVPSKPEIAGDHGPPVDGSFETKDAAVLPHKADVR